MNQKHGEQKATKAMVVINSAEELMKILSATLECTFLYKDRLINIPVTALSASTAEKVRELRRKALPPFKRDRGANGNYDELDPKYLKERDENEKKARALIIYSHCPMVAKSKVGLTNVDEIYAHVQTLFTENILEVISLTVQGGGLSTNVEERVDFTLAGGSET